MQLIMLLQKKMGGGGLGGGFPGGMGGGAPGGFPGGMPFGGGMPDFGESTPPPTHSAPKDDLD